MLSVSSSHEQPQSVRVFVCPHCERPALASVRGVAVWDGLDKEGIPKEPPAEWMLLQCSECGLVSVQVRADYGDGFDEDDPLIVFPESRHLSFKIPASLRREFEEAQGCFSAKAYGATVVMVRRVLEGTCKENNVQERTLVKSLHKLKEDGLIDGTIAEWADALRLLGNEGAHYTGRPVARNDAEDALAFTEALLDHIYLLRKRFDEFAARRARGKPGSQ